MSSFFKVNSSDLDWKSNSELKSFFRSLVGSLNSINSTNSNTGKNSFKFLCTNEETFVCTDSSTRALHEISFVEDTRSMFEVITGYEDIVSKPVFKEDHFILNGLYYRFINVYEFPNTIQFGELASMRRRTEWGDEILPFFTFRGINPVEALPYLERIRRPHESNRVKGLKFLGTEKEDKKTNVILDEIDHLADLVLKGKEMLFETQYWYIVKATDKVGLELLTKFVVDEIQQRSGKCIIETVANKTILQTVVDDSFFDFTRTSVVYSSFLANNIPFIDEKVHSLGVQFQTLNGNNVNVDLHDRSCSNYSAIITGVPGSGKSFVANKIVYESILNGESVLIIDKQESFLRTTKFFDGNVFTGKFNPMQFRKSEYLIEFIDSFIPKEEMTKKLRGQIFEIISNFLRESPKGNFKDLVNEIDKSIQGFRYYFEELWRFITDEEIKLSKITYVDRNNYPDFLFQGFIVFIVEYFKNLKGRRKLVVDEVWEALKTSGDFLESSLREIRKTDGGLITITQRLKDFIDPLNPKSAGNVIYEISEHKFVFCQDVSGLKGFNDEEVDLVSSLYTKKGKYSKFFYKTKDLKKVLIYQCTELEHELFTTEKPDVESISKYLGSYEPVIGFSSAMERWVDFKYHHKGVLNV